MEEVGDRRMINDAWLATEGGRCMTAGGLWWMVDGRQIDGGQQNGRDDER